MNAIAVQAGWIVPVESSPIRSGWMVAVNGSIQFVGPELPDRWNALPRFVFPSQILVPGLINTHCHLEFSDLISPLPFEGSFIQWIGAVVRHRRAQIPTGLTLQQADQILHELRNTAMLQGLTEAYISGTRYVLDTITAPWTERFVGQALDEFSTLGGKGEDRSSVAYQALVGATPIYYHPCPEILDTSVERFEQTRSFADAIHHRRSSSTSDAARVGAAVVDRWACSPHAPYTVTLPRARWAAEEVQRHDGVLSMHLGESREEADWLRDGGGPIEAALAKFWDRAFQDAQQALRRGRGDAPSYPTHLAAYLQALAPSPRTLLAHGNYFSDDDLAMIAGMRNEPNRDESNENLAHSKMAIVHCPRTYRHFHPNAEQRYPLEKRLQMGVPHFLGTDSRASNPDLSLWREVLTIVEAGVPFQMAIAMVTTAPAAFLGLSELGSLEVGKRALCTLVDWGAEGPPDAAGFESLFSSCAPSGASLWSDSRAEPLELVLERTVRGPTD